MDQYQEWDGCDLKHYLEKTGKTEYELKHLIAMDEISLWFWFTKDAPLTTIRNTELIKYSGWFKVPGIAAVGIINRGEGQINHFLSPQGEEIVSKIFDFDEDDVIVDVYNGDMGLPERLHHKEKSGFQKPKRIPTPTFVKISKSDLFILPPDLHELNQLKDRENENNQLCNIEKEELTTSVNKQERTNDHDITSGTVKTDKNIFLYLVDKLEEADQQTALKKFKINKGRNRTDRIRKYFLTSTRKSTTFGGRQVYKKYKNNGQRYALKADLDYVFDHYKVEVVEMLVGGK